MSMNTECLVIFAELFANDVQIKLGSFSISFSVFCPQSYFCQNSPQSLRPSSRSSSFPPFPLSVCRALHVIVVRRGGGSLGSTVGRCSLPLRRVVPRPSRPFLRSFWTASNYWDDIWAPSRAKTPMSSGSLNTWDEFGISYYLG